MKPKQHTLDEPRRVKDVTRQHFVMVLHSFFDQWARILTPAEFLVFTCIQRFSTFGTGESDGFFTLSRCQDITGLHRTTVIRAMRKLEDYGLLIVAPRNGQASYLKVNQDANPPSSACRRGRNPIKNLASTSTPVGTGTSTPVGTGPVHSVGTGPVHSVGTGTSTPVGTGPVHSVGTASYSLRHSKALESPSDDDDGSRADLGILAAEFSALGMTLDGAMATRMLRAMRQARPDITAGEIMAVVRDRLPLVMRSKNIRTPMAYLLRAILEIAVSPAFDRIRAHYHATVVDPQEHARREAIEHQNRIEAWTLQARRGERWAQKACKDAGIDWNAAPAN